MIAIALAFLRGNILTIGILVLGLAAYGTQTMRMKWAQAGEERAKASLVRAAADFDVCAKANASAVDVIGELLHQIDLLTLRRASEQADRDKALQDRAASLEAQTKRLQGQLSAVQADTSQCSAEVVPGGIADALRG